jgi:hypothetical protein
MKMHKTLWKSLLRKARNPAAKNHLQNLHQSPSRRITASQTILEINILHLTASPFLGKIQRWPQQTVLTLIEAAQ